MEIIDKLNLQIEAAMKALERSWEDPDMDADHISDLREELYELERLRYLVSLH